MAMASWNTCYIFIFEINHSTYTVALVHLGKKIGDQSCICMIIMIIPVPVAIGRYQYVLDKFKDEPIYYV